MRLFGVICVFFLASLTIINCAIQLEKASFTYYDSYPACCPNSPNYSPYAPTDECDYYSGCEYIGDMAGFISPSNPDGHVSFQYVTTHNMVAFYDNSDPSGKYWRHDYANKTIEVSKNYNGQSYVFNCTITDTCGNQDCDNCCARNSQPSGYLIDMEYYTVINNFGTTDAVGGQIEFYIYD